MNTASVRFMFVAQAALLVAGQVIYLSGVLTSPRHSPQEIFGFLASAIGYGLSGAAYWVLVTRLPVELIGKLRPAFLVFGTSSIAATVGLLLFTEFYAGSGYPGYGVAAELISSIGGLLLAIAWFLWLDVGHAAPPQPVTLPPAQQPDGPIPG